MADSRIEGRASGAAVRDACQACRVPTFAVGELALPGCGLSLRALEQDNPEHRWVVNEALSSGAPWLHLTGPEGPELAGVTAATACAQGQVERSSMVLSSELPAEAAAEELERVLERAGFAHLDVAWVRPAAGSSPTQPLGADATFLRGLDALSKAQARGQLGAIGLRLGPDHAGALEAARDMIDVMSVCVAGSVAGPSAWCGSTAVRAAELGIPRVVTGALSSAGAGALLAAVEESETEQRVRSAVREVRTWEGRWAAGLGARVRVGEGDARDLFRFGQELERRRDQFAGDLPGWQAFRSESLAPLLARLSGGFLQALRDEARAEFAAFWEGYGTALHELFVAIEADLARGVRSHGDDPRVLEAFALHAPGGAGRAAEWALRCAYRAGASGLLVGARRMSHLRDVLEVARDLPELSDAGDVPAPDPTYDLTGLARALAPLIADLAPATAPQAADDSAPE